MSDAKTPLQVAVLDDYQGVSEPHFDALDKSRFSVVTFKDTLLPWGHPDTPQHVREALVHRLEPFHVICNAAPSCIRHDRSRDIRHASTLTGVTDMADGK